MEMQFQIATGVSFGRLGPVVLHYAPFGSLTIRFSEHETHTHETRSLQHPAQAFLDALLQSTVL